MNRLEPGLHKPVPMGTKVVIPKLYLGREGVTGVVAGISSLHVVSSLTWLIFCSWAYQHLTQYEYRALQQNCFKI